MGIIKRIKKMFGRDKLIGLPDELFKERYNMTPKKFNEALGDGKAIFIGEGTEEEFNAMEKERKGFKGIFGTK